MSRRLPSPKALGLTLGGLAAAWLLFAWLALPALIQSQAESFIAEKSGHRLALDRPEFNPFELSLKLTNLRLEEPDGKPLLAFGALRLDLSAASLWRRAVVFDAIRLEEPQATVVLRRDGRLNWSALIEALKDKDEPPDSPPLRLQIGELAISGGRIDFADEVAAFATRIEPLELELANLSTLPDGPGRYRLSARTAFGARIDWHGEASLAPPSATGDLDIADVDLARLAPYLEEALPLAPPAGLASVAAHVRLGYADGRAGLELAQVSAKLAGLRLQGADGRGPGLAVEAIEAKDGHFDLARRQLSLGALDLAGIRLDLAREGGALRLLDLGGLSLANAQVDLASRSATLERIALTDGRVRATRDGQGRIDVVEAVRTAAEAVPAAPRAAGPAAEPWRYRIGAVELAGFAAALRDESVTPAAELALEDIALAVEGLNEDPKAPLAVRGRLRARDGGSLEATGRIVRAGPEADIAIRLADLAVKPLQPYLAAATRLQLAGGRLSSEGRASFGARGTAYRGNAALRELRLDEADTGKLFLAWKSLGSRAFEVTPAGLDVGELTLDGLDGQILIAEDKTTNLQRILRSPAAAPAAAPVVAAGAATPAFAVNIDRLRIADSELDFADLSLALPFGTRIHHLSGALHGLSSRPGAPSQVELDGQVDDHGLARAAGQIDFFDPTRFMDLRVSFRNVEMTRLTPYSATFAGRRIASGKLSLDLEYKIKQRQLAGDNQIVMDQLTLGERVESAQAKDLPLDLAIAILQDADGRIDLGLPVSGSLDDPQFSYGQLVWKAIVNVLTKIATAPFRALGALFGGGERFESIAFEPGDARLTPPEREKLGRLAAALAKRPGLSLGVHGVWAEADRLALQDGQLRRAVAERTGQRLDAREDPGPLSTRSPKVQAALEGLFADRLGAAELAALKEGFRKANPGQLEEGAAGRMLSRLSGLLRERRTLSEQEVAQLKGADFHALLFDRLSSRETVAETQLQALAKARGEHAVEALKAAGVPADRLALLPAERVEAEGRDVPIKLELGAVAR